MKVLLVVDGSSYSEMATRTLKALRLPSRTEVTVMPVVPEHTFLGGITLDMLKGGVPVKKEAQQQKRPRNYFKVRFRHSVPVDSR